MDPDNILSLLAQSGQPDPTAALSAAAQAPAMPAVPQDAPPAAPAANVLQALAPQAPPPPQFSTSPADVYQAATAASPPPPQPRHSLLDTIGRISDVIAKVGGADPLYQSTLDARQAHDLEIQKSQLGITHDTIANETDKFKFGDLNSARIARAARGVQAIMAKNPNADPSATWAVFARQAGIPDDHISSLGAQIAADPATINGLAALDQDAGDAAKIGVDKLGHNVYFGTDGNGKTVAYQVGDDGQPHILDFGAAGVTPTTPIKVVNTGSANVIVGQDGQPIKILPNSVSPDTAANNQTSRANTQDNNRTSITVAGMPARTKDDGTAGDQFGTYSSGISSLRTLDKTLGDLVSDPNLPGATGLVGGHLNLTDGQRAIKGKIASIKGQAIPAAIAAIKAAGGAAPRSVIEITSAANGLTAAIENRDMPTSTYIQTVNAARARLRQSMQNMTNEVVRQGYATRGANGQIVPVAGKSAAPNGSGSNIPMLGPADAAKLPKGASFRTLDGRILVRQ